MLDGFLAIPAAAVIDGVAYFGKGSDFIFGVDSGTGEELWRYQPESGLIRRLLEDGGVFYAFFWNGDVIALLPRIERSSE